MLTYSKFFNSILRFSFLLTASFTAFGMQTPKKQKLYCGENTNPDAIYCPSIKNIKYNPSTELLETEDGWKSTQKLLAPKIQKFSGAQWSGWQTGNVICVYKSASSDGFPITMTVSVPINKPKVEKDPKDEDFYAFGTSKWQEKKQNGINKDTMLCIAANSSLCDCPFEVFIKKKRSIKEIIDSIKPDPYNLRYFSSPDIE